MKGPGKMKSIYILVCILAVVLGGAYATYGHRLRLLTNEPVLEIIETVDMGELDRGDVVEVYVPIRNNGRSDLVIEGIRTSCGCVAVGKRGDPELPNLTDLVVLPNSHVDLRVKFLVKGPKGGKIREDVLFRTNDPANPEVRLGMVGSVFGAVRVDPPTFLLGEISNNQTIEVSFLVIDERRPQFRRPLHLSGNSEGIKLGRLTPSNEVSDKGNQEIKDGSYYKAHATFMASSRNLQVSEIVNVCDEAENVVVSLPISGVITGKLVVSPSVVLLPRSLGAGEWTYESKCLCRLDGMPFDLKPSVVPPGLSVIVSGTEKPQMRSVTVKYAKENGPFSGTRTIVLIAELGQGKSQRIEIPVSVIDPGSS
jgi:hypothetical protein